MEEDEDNEEVKVGVTVTAATHRMSSGETVTSLSRDCAEQS